jgi:hypothetical protein
MPAMMRCLSSCFEVTPMAQDGAGELGEEALDKVEPGAVLGSESELEAVAQHPHRSSQFDRLPPSCHDANPRSPNRKRGIHQQAVGSKHAGFTESVG